MTPPSTRLPDAGRAALVLIRRIVDASRHPQSMVKILGGSSHGVAMFDTDADLKPSLVKWLAALLSAESPSTGR